MLTLYTGALLLGLTGSLHCIGMCGPLVLSLPSQKTRSRELLSSLVYQIGRILTYGLLGMIFGTLGQVFSLIQIQQPLTLIVGIGLLCFLFLPQRIKLKIEQEISKIYLIRYIKKQWGVFFLKQNTPAFFMLGVLNGMLPCGLVYAALAGAAAVGSTTKGGLFMVIFGIGTSPALIAANSLKILFADKLQKWRRFLLPVSIASMAVLFILRGSALGIPYLSPVFKNNKSDCCIQNHQDTKALPQKRPTVMDEVSH